MIFPPLLARYFLSIVVVVVGRLNGKKYGVTSSQCREKNKTKKNIFQFIFFLPSSVDLIHFSHTKERTGHPENLKGRGAEPAQK
jgi:hypothetical protein